MVMSLASALHAAFPSRRYRGVTLPPGPAQITHSRVNSLRGFRIPTGHPGAHPYIGPLIASGLRALKTSQRQWVQRERLQGFHLGGGVECVSAVEMIY